MARVAMADAQFESYRFGGDVVVQGLGAWVTSDPAHLTRTVTVRYVDQDPASEPHPLSFNVKFLESGHIDEVFAVCTVYGVDVGEPAESVEQSRSGANFSVH